MVWNDARQHGTGDIFLQSFNLGSLTAVQSQPVRINSRNNTGGWLFLPAVRQSDSKGTLNISFYSRSSANTALTDVSAATKVNPRTTIPPTKNNTTVTTGSSDWLSVSSIIVPNFGDYTDNYFVGTTLFVAWSDGRLGFPNPFDDHVSVH
jgi:glycerophosphoryl diester phosphodiesterase